MSFQAREVIIEGRSSNQRPGHLGRTGRNENESVMCENKTGEHTSKVLQTLLYLLQKTENNHQKF